MIKHLLHNEIDKKRWDGCLDLSLNRLPYAYSWWLDIVSPGWEALVQDDYKVVMPLTGNRKLGFDYLYQPFLTQQLGIFSTHRLTNNNTSQFLDAIPACYRYINIQLNTSNNPVSEDFACTFRKNFILDLSSSYIQLSTNFHRNCRRNILKAIHSGLFVKPGPGPLVFTRFVQRNLDEKLEGIGKKLYPLLQQITSESVKNQTGEILGVYKRNGELLAAGWFITAAGRCLFEVCASTAEGKKNRAMYLLVDHMIREKSGSALIFDFAGSNIPGIAYFNSGFGATEIHYPAVKRNQLPWPLRIFKR